MKFTKICEEILYGKFPNTLIGFENLRLFEQFKMSSLIIFTLLPNFLFNVSANSLSFSIVLNFLESFQNFFS